MDATTSAASADLPLVGFRRALLADGTQAAILMRSHGAKRQLTLLEAVMVPGAEGDEVTLYETDLPEAIDQVHLGNIFDIAEEWHALYGLEALGGRPTALTMAVIASAWVNGRWTETDLTDRVLGSTPDDIRAACTDEAQARAFGVPFHDGTRPGPTHEDDTAPGAVDGAAPEADEIDFNMIMPESDLSEFRHTVEAFFGCDIAKLTATRIHLARAIIDRCRPPLPRIGLVPSFAQAPVSWAVQGRSSGDQDGGDHEWIVGTYEHREDAAAHVAAANSWAALLFLRYGREIPGGSNPWDPDAGGGRAWYELKPVRRLTPVVIADDEPEPEAGTDLAA